MIEMTLTRKQTGEEGTFGLLESEALQMETGELPWKNNERGVSCIPTGLYLCLPHTSPRFGKCFWLQDVPGRSEILIHPANWMGDVEKGLKSDLEGCIAIGMGTGEDATGQDMILKSRVAVGKLIEYTESKPFMLHIINKTDTPMEVV